MTSANHGTLTPPFKRGGDQFLIEALNERQRHHDHDHDRAEDGEYGPQAISITEVTEVLHELGMVDGFDGIATELFFGAEGREGYTDGDERFAIDTYGGFVFKAPDEGRIYTITAARSSGWSLARNSASRPKIPRRTDNPSYLGELAVLLRRALFHRALRRRQTRTPARAPAQALSWSVAASAMCYEVQPRFHEDVNIMDFLPRAEDVNDPADAGLLSLYPPEASKSVCMGSGTIRADSAEEAISLAESLSAMMASHGVLCDPRVVLMDTPYLPLLPRQARNEALYESRTPTADSREDEDSDLLPYGSFLGEPHGLVLKGDHGHRVRQRRSSLVPEQSEAGWLACRASEYAAYEDRVRELQQRLDDPAIPERRKEALRHYLGRDAAVRDEAYQALTDQTSSLAGLLLSVFDERRDLAREAELRRQGA